MGLPLTKRAKVGFISSIGSFELLYNKMKSELRRNKHNSNKHNYGTAGDLNVNERKFRF